MAWGHIWCYKLITDEVWITLPMNKENVEEVIDMLNKTGEFEGKGNQMANRNSLLTHPLSFC